VLISCKPSATPAGPLTEAFLPKVYDGRFREVTDIRVERVVHALGSEPSRAEFTAVLDSYHRWKDSDGNVHEGELRAEQAVPPGSLSLGIDDAVIVAIPLGGGRVLVIFRGRITDADVSFSERGEEARLTAFGPGRMLDNRNLHGARFADVSGGDVVDTDNPLVFNPDNLGNFDSAGSETQGEPLFGDAVEPDDGSDDPYRDHWRVGTFWRYIIGNFAPSEDSRLPSAAGVPELDSDFDAVLPATDVEGMQPSEALSRVLGSYGLDWWADPFVVVNRWSVFGESPLPCFRIVSPRSAAVKHVRLQEPGSTVSRDATNVNSARISFSTHGSVNHWRVEGDLEEYEACYELKRLWTDEEESGISANPDKGNRSHSDYDVTLDHVHRQWGLNEDNRWPDRGAFDFTAFLGEGAWTGLRRRFLSPYATTDDEPRRFIVEVKNTDLDQEWHRVGSATIRLLEERAGIYFDMSAVDGTDARLLIEDHPPQALKGVTHVRMTAVVQSDERVVHDAPRRDAAGSSQTITRTVTRPGFRRVTRHPSSAYSSEGTGVVRDDASEGGPMEALAALRREAAEPIALGVTVVIPWVEFGYRVGERISRVAGREIALEATRGDEPVHPVIERITCDFRAQETEIRLRPWSAGAGDMLDRTEAHRREQG
jgi:hypothetical protein